MLNNARQIDEISAQIKIVKSIQIKESGDFRALPRTVLLADAKATLIRYLEEQRKNVK
jgi:hypothetical protein